MNSSGPRIRPEIEALPTYKAGKKADATPGVTAYKLSSNENPDSPLPSVLDAIALAATQVNRYPDPFATQLTDALAKKFDVVPADIGTGTGSVGVLQQIVQAVAGVDDEVMYAWRSFEAYPIVTKIAGATCVEVPLNSRGEHDLEEMAKAITDKTRVIFICTPNNPTGPIVRQTDVDVFLKKVPTDVLVVIDEAYIEFNRDNEAVNGLATYRMHSNVGVLRTFSKAYGLAGLRVGYFVGPENVAEAVRKTAVPFGVSSIAQAAAVASLEADTELFAKVDELVRRREWLERELRALGFDIETSQANFVWLPLAEKTDEVAAICFAHALAVRPFSGEGLRVSIGEQEALERFLTLVAPFAR